MCKNFFLSPRSGICSECLFSPAFGIRGPPSVPSRAPGQPFSGLPRGSGGPERVCSRVPSVPSACGASRVAGATARHPLGQRGLPPGCSSSKLFPAPRGLCVSTPAVQQARPHRRAPRSRSAGHRRSESCALPRGPPPPVTRVSVCGALPWSRGAVRRSQRPATLCAGSYLSVSFPTPASTGARRRCRCAVDASRLLDA